jgi:hypothetical protein
MIVMTTTMLLISCGGQQNVPAQTTPESIPTPEGTDTPTPTAVPPIATDTPTITPAPAESTITLENVHLVYDYFDTRGYMLGGEEATIIVDKLPVVIAGGVKSEIPLADIASMTLQPSTRQHPEVEHWDIPFLDAVVTLRNQESISCEIGAYLPLPSSGDKPASELYNTSNISDVYLQGEMADTGLTANVSLYDVQAFNVETPGDSLDSLGTVQISLRENKTTN